MKIGKFFKIFQEKQKLEKKLLGAGNRIGAASPVEGLCDAARD